MFSVLNAANVENGLESRPQFDASVVHPGAVLLMNQMTGPTKCRVAEVIVHEEAGAPTPLSQTV